jgi:hypothetical protein
MISSISSPSASISVQQYRPTYNAQYPPTGTNSYTDTVQLSDETQQYLTNAKASAPAAQPSFSEIVKEAADGDIGALAKLALIG